MKKNIVFIDLELKLTQSIYGAKKVNIEFLITNAETPFVNKLKKYLGW